MTSNQLLDSRLILLTNRSDTDPQERFTFNGCAFWTDNAGVTWLRDYWGYLLPVPHLLIQADPQTCGEYEECEECGGMGLTIGYLGPTEIEYPCEMCS